jgi:tripeptide aminopeptidase
VLNCNSNQVPNHVDSRLDRRALQDFGIHEGTLNWIPKSRAMEDILERFCRYVRVETTANEETDDYPSSSGQTELGRLLVGELKELGLEASIDEHSVVTATLPGNVDPGATICWLAHMDTSPEASGKDVSPQVVRNYSGGDIELKPGLAISAEDLKGFQGKTLVTTDGNTLLGADDKAGIAVIMTALARMLADPQRQRGEIRVVFTCDEEIGRGTDRLNLDAIGAVCAYTLDGEGHGLIENETFSADVAEVEVRGRNIHPGLAYGKMINAIRVAGTFLEKLPPELSPERTTDKEPFVHPYVLKGGVDKVSIRILLRSFQTSDLSQQAELLNQAAQATESEWPGAEVEVHVKEQYRNMAEFLDKEPRAVTLATEAYRKVGIEPIFKAIRGGTDGSRLSEMGLPTPNLSTGMHNFHSEREFGCLEEMETAVKVLLELATLWSRESA